MMVVSLGAVAVLARARHDTGVDDRDADPPNSTAIPVVDPLTVAPTTDDAVRSTT